MDNKLAFFAVVVFGVCQLVIGLPMFHNPIYISPETLQNLDTFLREENALNPILATRLTKREAPVYEPKITKSEEKKDLQSSATGYGGHGGGYGNAPTGYVGYGAKTGGYGAFSWYTNHPVGGGGYGHGGYH